MAFFGGGCGVVEESGECEYCNILPSSSFLTSSGFWQKELPLSLGPRQPMIFVAGSLLAVLLLIGF